MILLSAEHKKEIGDRIPAHLKLCANDYYRAGAQN